MHDIGDLEERMRRVEQAIDATPVLAGGGTSEDEKLIRVGTGNTLMAASDGFGDIKGCANPATAVTEVPSAAPASFTQTTTDGICPAKDETGTLVWVGTFVNDGTDDQRDLDSELIGGAWMVSRISVQVPITGGGGSTATVYLPWIDGVGSDQ